MPKRRRGWVFLVTCALGLAGCDSRGDPSPPAGPAPGDEERPQDAAPAPDEPPPAEEPEAKTSPTDGLTVREGELEYTELPRTKSVAAYMGVEFTLKGEGDPLVLEESDAVSHETLVGLHGKRVRVECTPRAPTPPDPESSYPTDMDGAPLPRPSKCVVSKLTPL